MVNEIENILKLLIEKQEEKLSIRAISKLRNINYKSAYNAILALEKQGIITLQKLGNTNLCSFNRHFNPLVFQAENERRNLLIKDKNFQIIYSRLKEQKFPFIALLFGSWAKKTASKHSDMDILFITHEEKIEKEISHVLSLIPLDIHPTFVSYKDFTNMAKSKEFSVVSEAIKNNFILIGIEEYYRLIENV